MDHREAQFRQEIVHARQGIDDKLAQLEHWWRHTLHEAMLKCDDVIDYEATGQWVQATRHRSAAVIARYPWLIVAGGALLGYCLSRRGEVQRSHAILGVVRSYETSPTYLPVGRT